MTVKLEENRMIAYFGKGSVGSGVDESGMILVIFTCLEGEINRELPEVVGKSTNEIGDCIELRFNKISSVDVVIKKLKEIKKNLKKEQRMILATKIIKEGGK